MRQRVCTPDNKILDTEEDRPCGRGGRSGLGRNGGGQQEQNRRHGGSADSKSGPSGSRGIQGGAKNPQGKPSIECWYCGKKGHRESKCWKSDKSGSGSGKTEQGNRQRVHYAKGSERARNGSGPTFVMKHKVNSMKESTSKPNEVWYVDSGSLNQMTSHKQWFSYLEC